MDSLRTVTTPELATRCAEETDKYYRRVESTTIFCFELLRRALREESGEAFALVYQVYHRFVTNAVYQHPRFALTGESAEYFVNDAFRAFERALRGPKFNAQATLPAILNYLKRCAVSSVGMYLRGKDSVQIMAIEHNEHLEANVDLAERSDAEELWQRVVTLLPDEHDRLLARLVFILQYRPREIIQLHPSIWSTERSVSVALFRIRSVLRQQLLQDDEREAGSGKGS